MFVLINISYIAPGGTFSGTQVVSLRRRLLRYEPDDDGAKREDEDDEDENNCTAAEGKD